MPTKQVIVVRGDLDLSPGKLAVQVAHGAVNAALAAESETPDWFRSWRDGNHKKVCVVADDEEALLDLEVRAEGAGIPNAIVRDAGRTEIVSGTITALALGPAPDDTLDPLTGDLSLL